MTHFFTRLFPASASFASEFLNDEAHLRSALIARFICAASAANFACRAFQPSFCRFLLAALSNRGRIGLPLSFLLSLLIPFGLQSITLFVSFIFSCCSARATAAS